jgi:integrase
MAERRGKGEGAIYQEAEGRWRGVVDLGYAGGRRRRKKVTGRTRQEVVRKLAKIQGDLLRGIEPAGERERLGPYLDRWLAYCESRVRPSTYASYSEIVESHIKPDLGRIVLSRLQVRDVQELLRRKAAETKTIGEGEEAQKIPAFSPRRVAMIREVLRNALAQGVPALVVKEILGHSAIGLTLSTYAHLLPGANQEAARAMEKLLGEGAEEDGGSGEAAQHSSTDRASRVAAGDGKAEID